MADERPPEDGSESALPPQGLSEEPLWEIDSRESEGAEHPGSMNFLDHLEELRWTLAKCVGVFLLSCGVVIFGLTQIASLMRWPYEFAVRGREGDLFEGLINTSFMGVFSVVFQLMLIGGFALSLPFILFFLGRFIAPGLKPSEVRLLLPGCIGAVLLFLVGASFSFFVLLPAGLRASIYFNDMLGFELLITASSYYGLLTWATLGVGLAFEFPLILILLVYLGVLTPETLARYRRHAMVLFLIISALVTPTPDPVTFLFLAVPLYVLYELSIWMGHRVRRFADRRRSIEA